MNNSKLELFTSTTVTICNSEFLGQTVDNVLMAGGSTIILAGQVVFANNTAFNGGAMLLHSGSNLTIAKGANVIFSNNVALSNGGAIYLFKSTFKFDIQPQNSWPNISLTFINNKAHNKGGALYYSPGVTAALIPLQQGQSILDTCFLNNFLMVTVQIHFFDNLAANGGDSIYGSGLNYCSLPGTKNITISPNTLSSVSSDPLRVCICDDSGIRPQCDKPENSGVRLNREIYPGQSFTVPVAIVGLEYGTTAGTVYSNLLQIDNTSNVNLHSNAQNGHVISNTKQCSVLNYTLFSNHTLETVTVYISAVYLDAQTAIRYSRTTYSIPSSEHKFHYTFSPILFNVTLLQCPPGFILLDNRQCDCYLHRKLFDNCMIINRTGYFVWSTDMWVTVYENGLLYNTHCPFDYCNKMPRKFIDLQNDSDSQCAFNRAGRLCGGCKEGYSLAIGSSHCIHCPNNNNLALLIFSAGSGFLLVLFITALNLTVKQGMINGLIYYAHVVWTYQSIFFTNNQSILIFLKIFIA